MRAGTRPATAADELPVFFPAGNETLFGVLTRPPRDPNGLAVILLPGADYIPSLNRNRLWVRLSRRLAASGYHVFRFDYHGVGESTGLVEHFELADPFTEDLEGAVTWLRGQGLDQFVFVGVCFGAATALSVTNRLHGVRGLMMIAHPVIENEVLESLGTAAYLRNLIREEGVRGLLHRAKRTPTFFALLTVRIRASVMSLVRSLAGRPPAAPERASPQFVRQLRRVVERRIPTIFVYGEAESELLEFEAVRRGRLGPALRDAGERLRLVTLDGPVHDLARLDVQDALIDLTHSWMDSLGDAASQVAARGA